ncbi:MAG: CoA-transferase [Dehalococcoidia bacterium]|nr:CoA-transferase [Dehalococcoidia bacterium]
MTEKQPLNRDQMAAVLAQRLADGSIVNLGIGIPTGVSNFLRPEQEIVLTSENGVIGYGRLAGAGEEDPDIVNASATQSVTLNPGAAIVHHADSFALIRRGLVDVTCLGAYEVAPDGSFANWKTTNEEWNNLGGIGGAMDLAACSKQIFLALEHTTRDGEPRLVKKCALPVTAPAGVTLVVTNIAVVSVRDGKFILEEHAPGYSAEDIQAVTGAPLEISPDFRQVSV